MYFSAARPSQVGRDPKLSAPPSRKVWLFRYAFLFEKFNIGQEAVKLNSLGELLFNSNFRDVIGFHCRAGSFDRRENNCFLPYRLRIVSPKSYSIAYIGQDQQ